MMVENTPKYFESETGVTNYEATRSQALWHHVKKHTLKSVVGDVTGKAVLDLGCGGGSSCAAISQWGAGKVVGYDISPLMINVCREKHIPDAEFYVCDARRIGSLEHEFDIVATLYAMQYMDNYSSLLAFIRSAYNNLKPGGLFCGFTAVHEGTDPLHQTLPAANIAFRREGSQEFSKVWVTFGGNGFDDEESVVMLNYAIYSTTLEAALKEVGFGEVKRQPILVSEEGERYFDKEELSKQMRYSYVFTAKKVHQ